MAWPILPVFLAWILCVYAGSLSNFIFSSSTRTVICHNADFFPVYRGKFQNVGGWGPTCFNNTVLYCTLYSRQNWLSSVIQGSWEARTVGFLEVEWHLPPDRRDSAAALRLLACSKKVNGGGPNPMHPASAEASRWSSSPIHCPKGNRLSAI